jgi:hypothetical protein
MPVDTDRLGDVDLFIKAVAIEVDAKLGAGYVFATYDGAIPASSPDSFIDVPFPLTTVVGAIVQATGTSLWLTNGVPQYCDPVPPASIGKLMPYVGRQLITHTVPLSGGVVRCLLQTTTYQGTTGSTPTNVGYGARPVTPGGGYQVTGLAWGIA